MVIQGSQLSGPELAESVEWFNPGERVHTFTSPLGVLLPALCTWMAGADHEAAALWLFRLLNAALLGAMAWLNPVAAYMEARRAGTIVGISSVAIDSM